VALPPSPPPRAVVVAGMGGSAIAADLAAGLWHADLRVPVVLHRAPGLPGWVADDCHVLVSSFSGATAETLDAYDTAGRRGAKRTVLSTGGELAQRAARDGVPALRLEPGGQPRAALGQGLAATLRILEAVGALDDPTAALLEATDALERALQTPSLCLAEPEQSAAHLAGRMPIVYAPHPFGAVARRLKAQFNENAKLTAHSEELPELQHNAVEGYAGPAHLAECATVVGLEPHSAEPDAAHRIAITRELLIRHGITYLPIRADFGRVASDGLALVGIGDLLSVRIAHHRGLDPSPVPEIAWLKQHL
jgi:glucose/mannose-6-phosphate isomerase